MDHVVCFANDQLICGRLAAWEQFDALVFNDMSCGNPANRRQFSFRPTRAGSPAQTAQGTSDPFIQEQMLEIAQKWRSMAAFEEKYVR